jgi:hypothetical protein
MARQDWDNRDGKWHEKGRPRNDARFFWNNELQYECLMLADDDERGWEETRYPKNFNMNA